MRQKSSASADGRMQQEHSPCYHETDLLAEFVGFMRAEWPAVALGAAGIAALYGLVPFAAYVAGVARAWGWL